MSKKSTGRPIQNNPSNSDDMAVLNARAAEGRRKAAQRKAQAAGHAAPQQSARPNMGRTSTARQFYRFDFGARFMVERPIRTEKGAVLIPAGEVIEIIELIGERGRKVTVIGKGGQHHILTTSQLYKGVAA